jgi:AraC family transcriptional regulator, regulatory protein of adaptative response / methylated-DNA-[protein]-cysteine methyltransferase
MLCNAGAANMTDDFTLIAAAIDYLIEHRSGQPSLDDVATHVGLSRFHFQRLFKRYAGVTPKQFLAALTLESAKPLLDRNASVLDAALDVGLSSPARLHDHFVSIDAMSPGEYKSGGADMRATYGFAQTPFGIIRVVQTPRGIAMLDFVDGAQPIDPAQTPLPHATFVRDDASAERVAQFAFGDKAESLRLHVSGTNFQLRVWNALLQLEAGERISYAQLARAIGEPNASRAVGNALSVNPVAVLIPCHRVIAASGAVGNYKWGDRKKRALLAWESAHTASD